MSEEAKDLGTKRAGSVDLAFCFMPPGRMAGSLPWGTRIQKPNLAIAAVIVGGISAGKRPSEFS